MVLSISIIIVLLFILIGIFFSQEMAIVSGALYEVLADSMGWFYLFAILAVLIFVIWIAVSPYGKIRLGKDSDRPDYSNFSWFAMLFCAGMGVGLVFWSVAEPASHFLDPPPGTVAGTAEAANVAMQYTFLHWGLHPWAIYTIVGLGLAYATFRKDRPCLISSIFKPCLSEKKFNYIGKGIDVFAIILTAIGVATSLGLGTLQVNGGLTMLFNIPNSIVVQVIIIVIVTILFLIDAVTGLEKGIKVLSDFNIVIAVLMIVYLFIFGPLGTIFKTLFTGMGGYLNHFFSMSLNAAPFEGGDWSKKWTIFYWAWWISWGPFVGTFIARISKGRTIREFVFGVLLVPTAFSLVWFAAFGGTLLDMELRQGVAVAGEAIRDINTGLFVVFSHLPGGFIASILAMILVLTFFITSADSATFVISMFSRNGDLNPDNKIKVTWGIFLALIAVVLLLSGGLQAIQNISIIISLPFGFILLWICWAMLKELRETETKD
ncbi:MAG: BCCT family transporter [Eubacterium sp.]